MIACPGCGAPMSDPAPESCPEPDRHGFTVEGRAVHAADARRQMMMWATGQRSHTNFIMGMAGHQPHENSLAQAAVAVADAAEVQKWAALYIALRGDE